ncbi:MAG: phosphoribosylglycinamide formyltransferase [Magnetococcales bacterium]|nr:phosphoribosylglycinamide formyltransferase [Magnetococcales bacterium]
MNETDLRIGVVVSGSGSNLQALIDRCEDGFIPGRVVLVISNVADVLALTRAERHGIPHTVISHRDHPSREAFESAMIRKLDKAGVDLVCLAGFLRVLTPLFVRHYRGRLLNIHPALLPAFPGLHVQQQALDAGVRFSGATVHFVDEGVDSGPIVVQAVVPILDGDDADTLSGRILQQEHRIYPLAVRLFAQKRLDVRGRRVFIRPDPQEPTSPPSPLINPPLPGPHS